MKKLSELPFIAKLGMVVAVLKDRHGDIELSLPLQGSLSDRSFDWGEAVWASARQIIWHRARSRPGRTRDTDHLNYRATD